MTYISRHSTIRVNLLSTKRASVVLEAAIATPIIVSVIAIILIAINLVRSEVILTHAVDQVSNELSMVFPVMDAGIMALDSSIDALCVYVGGNEAENQNSEEIDPILKNVGQVTGIITSVFNHFDINIEDIASTLILGKYVKTRIESEFEKLGESQIIVDAIKDISVYLDFDKNAHVLNIRVYYKLLSPFGSKDKMIASTSAVYGKMFYDIFDSDETKNNSEIWDESNFIRGTYFRKKFGANLPFSYPVIAGWNNGKVTSIKSIDLTAPIYDSDEEIMQKIEMHIDELAEFSGTERPWGKDEIEIYESDITDRELIVIIPENSQEERKHVIEECIGIAEAKGINLKIETYGVSDKYE